MDSKFEYFIQRTDRRFDKIDQKLETLLAFKAMLFGGSAVVTIFLNLLFMYFESRH